MYEAFYIGLVMRTFTRDPEDLNKQVKKVIAATQNALGITNPRGKPLFDRIDIVIPTDKRYKMSDFGGTAEALCAACETSEPWTRVVITEIAEGDNNVGVLNAARRMQTNGGDVDFMIVNSPSASGYLTRETALAMCEAFHNGAAAVGVSLPESPHPTLVPKGLITNTLAGWDTGALGLVGGFDEMAALSPIGGENPNAGVEEIPVLLKMLKLAGSDVQEEFIAVIESKGNFVRWQLPPEGTEDRAHHDRNHATKLERMQAHAGTLGMDLNLLSDAVMRKYRVYLAE